MFVVRVTGVTAFICTAIIFILLIMLVADLVDVYLNADNQFNEIKD